MNGRVLDKLYQYPEIYNALRSPTRKAVACLREIIRTHLARQPKSIMDPACGPATWLAPLAKHVEYIAGNDISPVMISMAKQRLSNLETEIIVGDLQDLSFLTGPFEVTIELSGMLSVLGHSMIDAVLQQLANNTKKSGIVLLTLHFVEYKNLRQFPQVIWKSQPVRVGRTGRAVISYQVIEEDVESGLERIQRTVLTRGLYGIPPIIEDFYTISLFTPEQFQSSLSKVANLKLESVYGEDWNISARLDNRDLSSERLLVLRRI